MANNLKTGWVIVATSGNTTDGREIKKEWLKEMAESYNPSLYSAKLWPDHLRDWGSQGKVLALKIENAADPQLAGEIQLMAILAPSDDLVYMNKRGKWAHTSIEVLKNFAGKGKTYLGGLAVTDTPASLGTSELQFSDTAEKFYLHGNELDLSSVQEEKKSFIGNLLNPKPKDDDQDNDMKDEQFSALIEANKATNQAITVLTEKFASITPAPATLAAPPAPAPAAPAEPEKFVSVKTFNELSEKLDKLNLTFDEMRKTPVGGTVPGAPEGDAQKEML